MSSLSEISSSSNADRIASLRSALSRIGFSKEDSTQESEKDSSSSKKASGFTGFGGGFDGFPMQDILSAQTQPSSSDMFSSMDTDSDGVLSESEFVAARPDDVSEEAAQALYAQLDTEGTGITEDQFASFEESKGAPMAAAGGMGPPPSASEKFTSMDTDGDGLLSESEFVAARPDDVSEEAAQALYAQLDTEGTGITEDQFASFEESKGTRMAAAGGASGTSGAGSAGGASSADEDFDELDTNEDGVVSRSEYLAGHPELDFEAQTEETAISSADSSVQKTALSQLMEAIKAYKSAGYDLNQSMFEQMYMMA